MYLMCNEIEWENFIDIKYRYIFICLILIVSLIHNTLVIRNQQMYYIIPLKTNHDVNQNKIEIKPQTPLKL